MNHPEVDDVKDLEPKAAMKAEVEAGEPADFEDNDPDGDHATEELRGPMVASTTHEEGFKPC